jgi:hypothetical protein
MQRYEVWAFDIPVRMFALQLQVDGICETRVA